MHNTMSRQLKWYQTAIEQYISHTQLHCSPLIGSKRHQQALKRGKSECRGLTLFGNPLATMLLLGDKPTPPSPLTPPSYTPIAKAGQSQTPSRPCIHPCAPPKFGLTTIQEPMPQSQPYTCTRPRQTSRDPTAIRPSPNRLWSVFPCNTQSKSNVTQNTACTITRSSMTFHSLLYLHAWNLPEWTSNMQYKQS